MVKAKTQEVVWEWLERDLPDSFFFKRHRLTPEQGADRFNEIPEFYKQSAYVMIQLATDRDLKMNRWKQPKTCLVYRHMLWSIMHNLKKKNIDLPIPATWFVDGPMILPEHIVRITNGLVLWQCDDSVEGCGYDNKDSIEGCIYYKFTFPEE